MMKRERTGKNRGLIPRQGGEWKDQINGKGDKREKRKAYVANGRQGKRLMLKDHGHNKRRIRVSQVKTG